LTKLRTGLGDVRFEVPKAMTMNIIVFWDIMQCSVVDRYQHFGESCCLHLQGKRVGQLYKNAKKVRTRTRDLHESTDGYSPPLRVRNINYMKGHFQGHSEWEKW
jgi:hypothetical protein